MTTRNSRLKNGGGSRDWLRGQFERGNYTGLPILCVLSTARRNGHTGNLADRVIGPMTGARILDLGDLTITPYIYDHGNDEDDFLSLAYAMTQARVIVFASPVYWYSMTGPMKIFFDRLTDITGPHKKFGKSLAGKSMFLIATGGSPTPPDCFAPPFADTANYFDMNWGGMLYRQEEKPDEELASRIGEFQRRIQAEAT